MLRALFFRRPQAIAPIEIAVDDKLYLVRVKRHGRRDDLRCAC